MTREQQAYRQGVYNAFWYLVCAGGLLTAGYVYVIGGLGEHSPLLAIISIALFAGGWWRVVHHGYNPIPPN